MATTVYPTMCTMRESDGSMRRVPRVVEDEEGFTIPASGKSVTWSAFYEDLARRGVVSTSDPSEEG